MAPLDGSGVFPIHQKSKKSFSAFQNLTMVVSPLHIHQNSEKFTICVALLDNGGNGPHCTCITKSKTLRSLLFSILESDIVLIVPIALTEFSLLLHKSLRPYFPSFLSALTTITIFIITALNKEQHKHKDNNVNNNNSFAFYQHWQLCFIFPDWNILKDLLSWSWIKISCFKREEGANKGKPEWIQFPIGFVPALWKSCCVSRIFVSLTKLFRNTDLYCHG